jgi:hypothetical protein
MILRYASSLLNRDMLWHRQPRYRLRSERRGEPMPSTPRSLRQEQRELSARLRSERQTWVTIAHEFCNRYGVNVRTALRMVRDWSQRDAAEKWNMRWPADPKTFKNFSYWELWPGPSGHAPSLGVLSRLAELYECSIADLTSDCADFRSRDGAHQDNRKLADLARLSALAKPAVAERSRQQNLEELITQLDSIDVHELARLTNTWLENVVGTAARRALLLKLSAGLSLAAASPLADESMPPSQIGVESGSFSGVWQSQYIYPSTGRRSTFTGTHYVVIKQTGATLTGQSLPHSTGSRLRIEMSLNASVASGNWQEITSTTGYYKGATYHGTLQLLVDPSGRRMHGMWLGFGRGFKINSGEWELTLEDTSTSKTVQRQYHNKA